MKRNPSLPGSDDPDRFLKCQEGMEDAFRIMAATATEAGWHAEEVAAALVELGDNHMLGVLADRDLARDLACLRK